MSENPDGDSRRLLASGTKMELADGAVHTVKFTNRSLAKLEEDFGSLEAFTDVMKAKPFGTVAYVISLTLGCPYEHALDLVETKRVAEYYKAISAALEDALPEPDQGNLTAAKGSESPGAAFSIPPSSSGTSNRRRSGK